MLQAGRSRVSIPMRSLNFFNLPDLSSRTMALGSTQPQTEMSTRNFPGGKRWPAHKADNLTAICELIIYRKCRNLRVPQSYGPPRPVTGTALPFTFHVL
jgi:hypothetical protein